MMFLWEQSDWVLLILQQKKYFKFKNEIDETGGRWGGGRMFFILSLLLNCSYNHTNMKFYDAVF